MISPELFQHGTALVMLLLLTLNAVIRGQAAMRQGFGFRVQRARCLLHLAESEGTLRCTVPL